MTTCFYFSIKHSEEASQSCVGPPMDIPKESTGNLKVTYSYSVKFEVCSLMYCRNLYRRKGYPESLTLSGFFFSPQIRSNGLQGGITFWCLCLTATSSGLGELSLSLSLSKVFSDIHMHINDLFPLHSVKHHELSSHCALPLWHGGHDHAEDTTQGHRQVQPGGPGTTALIISLNSCILVIC